MKEPGDLRSLTGLVIRGSRNIFTVRVAGDEESEAEIECRIKGKVLKGVEGFYNPLAPGDWVSLEREPSHPGKGRILAVQARRNQFTRLNQQGFDRNRSTLPQILAANIDAVFCVCTPASPPWRPRFLDRLLLQADIARIPSWIVCNKWDLFDGDLDINERLEDFRRIGYPVLRVSAKSGEGLEELREAAAGRLAALIGQSGVGKSTLINALLPGAGQKTGVINEKYDRGNHITSMAILLGGSEDREGPAGFIDTPGIRRLLPDGISCGELEFYMREFSPLAGKCSFGLSCAHRTEPGCKIMEAVHAGVIHEDRYESFLRIKDELAGKAVNE
ncbi:MAG: ribosome small subunit-dependent GTPase A [Treponema sp.]|jgi:ribosome biogenesis GTPase|nr:ribosome small subunit-dependent GTPase A [Treponema sp.]